ncbi:hypothetical protein [Microvirga thermotolerans]|uniref:UrcA family protein n=1 Tax=Microvirga thermotolerans TaxID=2651334 RepID=A0A5P9JY27_9HYPH|nr:hypothetical protein [Microvirga thermotolerans]QFU16658.1 hypothetical protein GDR74_10685 [Microvirga thermotolerans]
MLRLAAIPLFLLATPVVAAEVPVLDIQSTCKAAVALDPSDTAPQQTCMKEETEARADLAKQWDAVAEPLRRRCVEETSVGGYPSYVEVLTCIQTATGTDAPRKSSYRRPGR